MILENLDGKLLKEVSIAVKFIRYQETHYQQLLIKIT